MLGIELTELMYVNGSMYPSIGHLSTTQNHPFMTLLPATPGQIFHGNSSDLSTACSGMMLKGQEVVWALPRLKLISLVHSVAEGKR